MTEFHNGKSLTPTKNRIASLDVIRGIALLGILLANVHQMFLSVQYGNEPIAVVSNEVGVWYEWIFFNFFIDLKFLTIFSLLFGVGFALQLKTTKVEKWEFRKNYLRRLVLLAAIGIGHGLFLYVADVLTLYAITGLILLMMLNWSARSLMMGGLWLSLAVLQWSFAFETTSISIKSNLIGFAILAIGLWLVRNQNVAKILVTSVALLAVSVTIQLDRNPFGLSKMVEYQKKQEMAVAVMNSNSQTVVVGGVTYKLPFSKKDYEQINSEATAVELVVIEAISFRNGPAWLKHDIQADKFVGFQNLFLLYLIWRTLAIFMIGAGLVKWGILAPDKAPTWRRFAKYGLLIGLPLSALATWLNAQAFLNENWINGFGPLLHETSALLLGFAFTAVLLLWCNTEKLSLIQKAFASAGRVALTNYIGQSAIMAILTTWWGFGLYAKVGHLTQLGLAIMVFSGLMIFSHLWLQKFRMGPLEWLLRQGTYFKFFTFRK